MMNVKQINFKCCRYKICLHIVHSSKTSEYTASVTPFKCFLPLSSNSCKIFTNSWNLNALNGLSYPSSSLPTVNKTITPIIFNKPSSFLAPQQQQIIRWHLFSKPSGHPTTTTIITTNTTTSSTTTMLTITKTTEVSEFKRQNKSSYLFGEISKKSQVQICHKYDG